MFGTVTITMGIGPHSSTLYTSVSPMTFTISVCCHSDLALNRYFAVAVLTLAVMVCHHFHQIPVSRMYKSLEIRTWWKVNARPRRDTLSVILCSVMISDCS